MERSRFEIEHALERDDYVVVCFRIEGHGRRSGAPITARRWYAFRVRAEHIVRIAMYSQRDPALETAGIAAADWAARSIPG